MKSASGNPVNTVILITAFILIIMLSPCNIYPDAKTSSSLTNNELVITDKIHTSSSGKYIDFLEDKDGKLLIEDVNSDSMKTSFKRNNKEHINFGFTRSVYWLRFSFIYESDTFRYNKWLLEIAYPLLNHIEVYLFTEDRLVEKIITGRQMPYHERIIKNRNFIIPFDLKSGEKYTFFLKIKTDGSMNVPMTIRTPLSSMESVKDEQFFFGIYYGILFVMAILNLFMFFSVRNIDYLLYIFYVVSGALFQLSLNGLDVEYLWQNAQWWSLHAVPILGSLFSVFMNLFSKRFLQTKVYAPVIDKILTAIVVIFILNIPISIIFDYRIGIQILSLVSIFGSFATIAAGVQCLMMGYRPARLYVISFIGFIFGIIVLVLQNYNIVPYSFVANYSIQIGSALEVVLMSFALADRFKIMQKEKEKVQREAFDEQLKMANSFSRFVPREFLSLLKKESIVNIELGDQVLQEMPVLFTDIRSYTSLSEKMTPQENIDFLNLHLANVVPVIKSHNGFIDKFIGDAIMALFPGGVNDAVNAAVELQKKVKEFNAAGNAPEGSEINIGIGIHIGKLMLGTIGEKDRLETTVISDAVNIASRLEGLNKKFSTGILISEDVFKRLDNPLQFNIKKIGLVHIRGKENTVRIFEVAAD